MGRPGFVLEVDERTPPLVVSDGDRFRLEKLPLGARVVYPAESATPVVDVREAVQAALDAPLGSDPLAARLHAGMKLTIAFDDTTTPVPRMRRPDIRGTIIEAVLTRAARAGVDDVALICANGLHRRLTDTELLDILGERVFRSFFADGRLTHHDAEDAEQLAVVGSTDRGEIRINSRVADSDLLIFVHVVTSPRGGGAVSTAVGLGSAATIDQICGRQATLDGGTAAPTIAALVSDAVDIFQIEAVLDSAAFPPSLAFLAKREWEWSMREQAIWLAVRSSLALAPGKARRRLTNRAAAGYQPTRVLAGAPDQVDELAKATVSAQQLVEVDGQADVGVIGVPQRTPYSTDSVTNPVLAAWMGLGATFNAHTGQPVVREGGALILYHPLPAAFSSLHHPSYVDFFAEVLSVTGDPERIQTEFEAKFATDPWYIHLYRTSVAFHGVHPFYLWYQLAAARQHCSDIVWVGADRSSVERLGFRAASTLADALEIVASTVGRSPRITYLHSPPQLIADIR